MYKVDAYRINKNADIKQSGAKRSWMDQTYDQHAYNCFPMTLTNTLGWTISFPEDIHFVWNGVLDSNANNVKILQGTKYVGNERANGTISFKTGLILKTGSEASILTLPVPNLFNPDYQVFTSLISTSFFNSEFPIVAKIMSANKVITIKAGTPVATILPFSVAQVNNSEMLLHNYVNSSENECDSDYAEAEREKIAKSGKWTNFYRNAVDACGNVLGQHEAKKIIMRVVEEK
jgi:hypothetical protein